MKNLEDNIKIVDGNKRTLLVAKFLILRQKLTQVYKDICWKILVLLNKGKF